MEATGSSKTLVPIHPSIQQHIPEDTLADAHLNAWQHLPYKVMTSWTVTQNCLVDTYTNIQEEPAASIFREPSHETTYNSDGREHDNNNVNNSNNNNVQETNCMGTQRSPDSVPNCPHVLHVLYGGQ
jgi:hypothetical protein